MSVITITTDLGTLAAFDSEVLRPHVREKDTWWRGVPAHTLPEVAKGQALILPIGQEGHYRIEVRREPLEPEQDERVCARLSGLGVEVRSGELFCGAGERLPGDGRGDRLSVIPGTGTLLTLEPGRYGVTVHVLHWRHDDDWFDEEGEPKADAPPDFVLELGPPPSAPLREPLPALLDLLPRHEAKGSSRVPQHVRRRPSAPEPGQRRRGGGGSAPELEVYAPLPRVPAPGDVAPLRAEYLRAAFAEVLQPVLVEPLSDLRSATLLMRPRDRSLMAHDLDVPELMRKITRVREQLRVLEAKLNADERLEEFDKAELELYLTRAYQSLDALQDGAAY